MNSINKASKYKRKLTREIITKHIKRKPDFPSVSFLCLPVSIVLFAFLPSLLSHLPSFLSFSSNHIVWLKYDQACLISSIFDHSKWQISSTFHHVRHHDGRTDGSTGYRYIIRPKLATDSYCRWQLNLQLWQHRCLAFGLTTVSHYSNRFPIWLHAAKFDGSTCSSSRVISPGCQTASQVRSLI